jgi:hypothetical protein
MTLISYGPIGSCRRSSSTRSGCICGRSPRSKGFSGQTINRLQLSIRPLTQCALLASMRSADRRPITLAGVEARYSQRVWPIPVRPVVITTLFALALPRLSAAHLTRRAARGDPGEISASSGRESFPLRRAIQIVDAEIQVRT